MLKCRTATDVFENEKLTHGKKTNSNNLSVDVAWSGERLGRAALAVAALSNQDSSGQLL